MILAEAAKATDGAFSAGGVVSSVLAFLSVPAIVSGLAWLWQRLSPTGRLTARLTKDLAIFEKLPESPQRELFAEQISEVVGKLVARRERATASGKRARLRAWSVVVLVPLLALGVLVSIALPIFEPPATPLPVLPDTWVAAIAGAISASVGLALSALSRNESPKAQSLLVAETALPRQGEVEQPERDGA